ncbi:MAG: type II toxin-antitoxin system RelE/ParE family toxin [Burkholderiales bacterium]|nr:type II toxin-antitoxin system RelE/ParE family toxin [Burkholderiales bacterium]
MGINRNLHIIFRQAAKAEFIEAGKWYESKQAGLASEFMAEIGRCISLASASPEQFPVHRRDIRYIITKRFPYKIFFRTEPDAIVILAVFHNKRDPAVLTARH